MKKRWLIGSLLVGLASMPLQGQIKSEKFRLSRVGYIMMGVANLQAASQFYRDKLGLSMTSQAEDVAFFDAGTVSLVLSTAVGKNPGSTEVVFSVDHVQQAYKALSQAGVTFDRKPRPITDSSWVANFHDPDGHTLSLFGPQ